MALHKFNQANSTGRNSLPPRLEKPYKHLLLAVFVVILVASGVLLATVFTIDTSPGQTPDSTTSTSHPEGYWLRRIEEIGGKRAYDEFKAYQGALGLSSHGDAHEIGDALYQVLGHQGITICDSSFSFGCFHGLAITAIQSEGLEVLPLLEQACAEQYQGGSLGIGCLHGLGHGIVETLGRDNLIASLEACSTLSVWNHPLGGCPLGVFMEYSLPPSVNESGTADESVPFDPSNPYRPCPSVPEEFRQSCYFEIGVWWRTFLNFTEMGILCSELLDEYQETCYLSVGARASAPLSKFSVTEVIANCQKMPDARSEILCRAGAAWSFDAQSPDPSAALILCEDLTDTQKGICQEKSRVLGTKEK